MTNYVNGWDAPIFIAEQPGPGGRKQTFEFSFKYKALGEYYQRVTTVDEWDDGSATKISHFVKMHWRIRYPKRIQKADRLKFNELENLEIQGYQITLIPHKDKKRRKFKVLIMDEERATEQNAHFGGMDWATNSGFEFACRNSEPILEVPILDPDTYLGEITGATDPTAHGEVQT